MHSAPNNGKIPHGTNQRESERTSQKIGSRPKNNAVVRATSKTSQHSAEKVYNISNEKVEYKGQRMTRLDAAIRSVFDNTTKTGDAGALKKLLPIIDTGRIRLKQPERIDMLEHAAIELEAGMAEEKHLTQKIQKTQLKGVVAGIDRGKSVEEAHMEQQYNHIENSMAALLAGDPEATQGLEAKAAIFEKNRETEKNQREKLKAAAKTEGKEPAKRIAKN